MVWPALEMCKLFCEGGSAGLGDIEAVLTRGHKTLQLLRRGDHIFESGGSYKGQ